MDDPIKRNNRAEILDRVSNRVSSSEARSLWEKLREEVEEGEVDTAISYLAAELDRCKIEFDAALASLQDLYARNRAGD